MLLNFSFHFIQWKNIRENPRPLWEIGQYQNPHNAHQTPAKSSFETPPSPDTIAGASKRPNDQCKSR